MKFQFLQIGPPVAPDWFNRIATECDSDCFFNAFLDYADSIQEHYEYVILRHSESNWEAVIQSGFCFAPGVHELFSNSYDELVKNIQSQNVIKCVCSIESGD